MTTILYSGYYDPDKDKAPFEVDPNFFYLTSCDLPNVTIIKHHKKDYVLVEIPDISNYDAEHFKMKLKHSFNAEVIDLKDLLKFHKKNKKKITVTAVHPPARFGELSINKNLVSEFEEKPQLQKGWINGGFFVFQPEIFSYINGDETMLEREPLESLVEKKQLNAFKHFGMWQSMDTKREYELLQKLWIDNKAFWLPN